MSVGGSHETNGCGQSNLHSRRAKSFSLMKSGNVSLVREATSEAEAIAADAKANATHCR